MIKRIDKRGTDPGLPSRVREGASTHHNPRLDAGKGGIMARVSRDLVGRISETPTGEYVITPESACYIDERGHRYRSRREAIAWLRHYSSLPGELTHYLRPNGRVVKL